MSWLERLSAAQDPLALRAGRDVLVQLARDVEALAGREGLAEQPALALARHLEALTAALSAVEQSNADLLEAVAAGVSTDNERSALAEALTRMETVPDWPWGRPEDRRRSNRGLAHDLKAMDRHLDASAIEDRCLLRLQRVEQQWTFLARALAAERGLGRVLANHLDALRRQAVAVARRTTRHWTARAAACQLAGAASRPPATGAASTRQALLDLAHAHTDHPWVQAAALEAYLDLQGSAEQVETLLRGFLRLRPDQVGILGADHAWVRARAAGLAGRYACWDLLRAMLGHHDPSEHVRIAIVRALAASPRRADHAALLEAIRGGEPSAVVRAAAAVASLPDAQGRAPGGWVEAVAAAVAPGVAWTAETVLEATRDRLARGHLDADAVAAAREAWEPGLLHWMRQRAWPDLARLAATVLLWLEVLGDAALAPALHDLRAWLEGAPEGASRRYRQGPVADLDTEDLADLLALLASDDLDLSAASHGRLVAVDETGSLFRPTRGYEVFAGSEPRPRLWRVLWELGHLRPDKREAVSHFADQVPRGWLIAPSGRLAEVTPTGVPGRRVASPSQLWWGEDLPPPALLLAAAREGGVQVRTPLVNYLVKPRVGRLLAELRYTRLARLRERALARGADEAAAAFDAALEEHGFKVERLGALAGASLLEIDDLVRHVLATDSNTVAQLGLLAAGWTGWWVGRDLLRQHRARRHRELVPLVIGGWGTRGKSGTERLKAALFQGLGYTVLAKTTGSEAALVSGIPGAPPTEIPLFRPGGRASIVEQRAVLRLAAEMGVQVLLWECMALQPEYVRILQRGWMHDDLTTLTNAWPDHEDVQGPTGREVALSIATVMPPRGRVVTTEQHMSPLLARQARRVAAQLAVVPPESWRLLPTDLMARFPYAEHPRNVALVVALADELGVPADVALQAMIAHVLPDVGVLREYGPIDYRGRSISFVNGMAANERAGFLSNQARMGFEGHTDASGLAEWSVVLINNRADRLPRQTTFARLAALEVSADTLAVTGTNVGSFLDEYRRFLRAELLPRLLDLDRAALRAALGRRLRRDPLPAERARDLALIRGAVGEEAIDALVTRFYDGSVAIDTVSARLQLASPRPRTADSALAQWLREVSWLWRLEQDDDWSPEAAARGLIDLLETRVLALEGPGPSGDQLLHLVTLSAPPDATVRILGAANIKGTGLAFVHRWLNVQRVNALLRELGWADASQAAPILRRLASLGDYGVADSAAALQAVRRRLDTGGFVGIEAEASATVERLATIHDRAVAALDATGGPGAGEALRRWAHASFTVLPAIRARRLADQLYRDLAVRRVGAARAARVARALVEQE